MADPAPTVPVTTASSVGSLNAFAAAVAVNSVLVAIVLFIFLMIRPLLPKIYLPRFYILKDTTFPIAEGLFKWVSDTIAIDPKLVHRRLGVDSYLVLRYTLALLKALLWLSALALVVLIPVHTIGRVNRSELSILSILNVPDASRLFYVHAVLAYAFTAIVLYYLADVCAEYLELRYDYLSQLAPQQYSVLVTNVPEPLRTRPALTDYFNRLYGDSVASVHIIRSSPFLVGYIEQREDAIGELQAALRFEKRHPEATHRSRVHACLPCLQCCTCAAPRSLCCSTRLCGQRVPSIDFFAHKLDALNMQIDRLQRRAFEVSDVAIVSFKSLYYANVASQAHNDLMKIVPAPEPREILWETLVETREAFNSTFDRFFRYFLSWVMTLTVILIWSFFTVFVSSIGTSAQSSWLKPIEDAQDDVWTAVLRGIVPQLVLFLLQLLIPEIMRSIASVESNLSKSELEAKVLNRVFLFQIFNSFVMIAFARTLMMDLRNIIDHPASLFEVFGKSVPAVSGFFANWVLLLATTVQMFRLLRGWSLLLYPFRSGLKPVLYELLHKRKPAPALSDPDLTDWFMSTTFVFFLAVTYAPLQPLVLFTGLAFFAVVYFVCKYMLTQVYVQEFERGGQQFPAVFARAVSSLVLAQFVLICILVVKKAVTCALLLAPLPFISIGVYLAMHHKYLAPGSHLPLGIASDLDSSRGGDTFDTSFLKRVYVEPAFRAPTMVTLKEVKQVLAKRAQEKRRERQQHHHHHHSSHHHHHQQQQQQPDGIHSEQSSEPSFSSSSSAASSVTSSRASSTTADSTQSRRRVAAGALPPLNTNPLMASNRINDGGPSSSSATAANSSTGTAAGGPLGGSSFDEPFSPSAFINHPANRNRIGAATRLTRAASEFAPLVDAGEVAAQQVVVIGEDDDVKSEDL